MKIRRGSAFVRCIGLLVCLLLLSFNYGETGTACARAAEPSLYRF